MVYEVISSIYPILVVSSIFCVLPISTSDDHGIRYFHVSKCKKRFCFLVFFFVSIGNILSILHLQMRIKEEFYQHMILLDIVSDLFSGMIVMVISLRRTSYIVSILMALQKLDISLKLPVPYVTLKKLSYKTICGFLLLLISRQVSDVLTHASPGDTTVLHLITTFFFYLVPFLNVVELLLFYVLSQHVHERLSLCKKALKNIHHETGSRQGSNVTDKTSVFVNVLEVRNKYWGQRTFPVFCEEAGQLHTQTPNHKHGSSNEIRFLQEDNILSNQQTGKNKFWYLHCLEAISFAYDLCCECISAMNKAFGLCSLVDVATNFTHLVLFLFYSVKILILNREPQAGLIYMGLSIIFYSAKLFLWTLPSSGIGSEVDKIRVLVQKLRKRKLDAEIKEELQMFAAQLHSRNIGFTACGFFSLDFTLLYTIAGAVTTYLVILVQFQISDRNSSLSCSTPQILQMTLTPSMENATENVTVF